MTTDTQIDHIYDVIDELLLRGKFDHVDTLLYSVSSSLNLDLILAYLTITVTAKDKLQNRARLLTNLKRRLPFPALNILKGLE
jgi:hypothetical protein